MGRKVPKRADSLLVPLLGQPKLGLVPTWARVLTWSGTNNLHYKVIFCFPVHYNHFSFGVAKVTAQNLNHGLTDDLPVH